MSNPEDVCPPLYVPTLAECEDALHEARQTMMALVTPGRWDFDAMKCGHSEHRVPATADEWAREAGAAIIACRRTTREAAEAPGVGRVPDYAADDAALQRAFAAVDALAKLATAASSACLATRTRGTAARHACVRTAGHTGRHHDGIAPW